MILRLWGVLCLIVFLGTVGVSAQEAPAPYIYYFSDILHGIVIERADGTDSRLIGQDVIPESYNSISYSSWSPSGRWLVYNSHYTGNHGVGINYQSDIIKADGQEVISFESYRKSRLMWSPVDDLLLSAYYIDDDNVQRIKIVDPNLNQNIFEMEIDGHVVCESWSNNCNFWSADGTKISFMTKQDNKYILYEATAPDFKVIEIPLSIRQPLKVDIKGHNITFWNIEQDGFSLTKVTLTWNIQIQEYIKILYTQILGILNYFSPDYRYIRRGKNFYDFANNHLVARSYISANIIGEPQVIWQENSDWALLGHTSGVHLSGFRSSFYEIVKMNDTFTRELTECYDFGCVGWLPTNVEPFLSPDVSQTPILAAPTDTLDVEGYIKRLAWSPDGTQLQVITSFGADNPAQLTVWDINTKQKVSQTEIPTCSYYDCKLAWDIELWRVINNNGMHLINRKGSKELTFDESTETYTIRNLHTNSVLYSWTQQNDNLVFRWSGETLFIGYGVACAQYWHESHRNGFVSPMDCEFSDYHDDYALIFSPNITDRTYLLNTVTGKVGLLNFYAQDASFHPDGTRFALGSKNMITFWDIEDVMENAQTPE